jgi:hypothetical protein
VIECIVSCYKCGRRVASDRSKLAAECGQLRATWPTIDLCSTCAGALADWLDNPADSNLHKPLTPMPSNAIISA